MYNTDLKQCLSAIYILQKPFNCVHTGPSKMADGFPKQTLTVSEWLLKNNCRK